MLELKKVTKIYRPEKGAELKALNDVSVKFGKKGLVFLSGKSGSGKSTMLNILGGIDCATSGELIVEGHAASAFTASDFDSYRNTCVGFIFQEFNLIDGYTVGKNIGLALELQGKCADKSKIDNILCDLELTDDKGGSLYHRRVSELSGGQRQRVAIARALIKDPEIILADEPTGAVDSETAQQIYSILKGISKKRLVIVVTHDHEFAQTYGDRIIELKNGTIIRDCSRGADGHFMDTKPEAAVEPESRNSIRFIRSKLSFKHRASLAVSAFRHKKFRLFSSVFLSVITFIIFGFSIIAASADGTTAELKALYDKDLRMIQISGNAVYCPGTAWESSFGELTDEQFQVLKAYNNHIEPMKICVSQIRSRECLGAPEEFLMHLANVNPYFKLGLSNERTMEVNTETGEQEARLKPDERFIDKSLCRLPQNFQEVAITDLKADMFIKLGYRSDDGVTETIQTPDDLIGKTLNGLTICGVYATEMDRTYFEAYNIDDFDWDSNHYLQGLIVGSMTNSVIVCNFVAKGYIEHKGINGLSSVMVQLSGNIQKDKGLLKALTYETVRTFGTSGDMQSYPYSHSASMQSPYESLVGSALLYKNYLLVPAFIMAAVFAFFSVLLMMNFITVSMDFRKKELGILRALGARRKDIVLICLTESFIIASINFILSILSIAVVCIICNIYFCVPLFLLGLLDVALLVVLVFGVSAVATVFPAMKTANRKPVEIISKSR